MLMTWRRLLASFGGSCQLFEGQKIDHTGETPVGGIEFKNIKMDFDFGHCMQIEFSQQHCEYWHQLDLDLAHELRRSKEIWINVY